MEDNFTTEEALKELFAKNIENSAVMAMLKKEQPETYKDAQDVHGKVASTCADLVDRGMIDLSFDNLNDEETNKRLQNSVLYYLVLECCFDKLRDALLSKKTPLITNVYLPVSYNIDDDITGTHVDYTPAQVTKAISSLNAYPISLFIKCVAANSTYSASSNSLHELAIIIFGNRFDDYQTQNPDKGFNLEVDYCIAKETRDGLTENAGCELNDLKKHIKIPLKELNLAKINNAFHELAD